jgi:hypothetical protein
MPTEDTDGAMALKDRPRAFVQSLARLRESGARVALAAVLGASAGSVAAGGAGASIVFDPTNFGKNAVTASETVQQTIEQVKANALNLEQVQQLVAARKQLSQAELAITGGMASASEIARRVNDVKGLLKSLESLSNGVKNAQTRFNVRFNAAQALGLTLAAYYEQVKKKADAGAQKVQAEIVEDKKALESVNAAHEQILKWTDTISGLDSQVASLAVLGSQMNLMVAQNAELMSFMVRENKVKHQARIDAEKSAQKAADEDQKIYDAAKAAYKKSQDDLQAAIKPKAK